MIVQKSEVVGVFSDLGQDVTGMSESVSNGDSFQSSDGTVVVLGFSQDFFSDGRGVFASITLSENVESMIAFEFELVETACRSGEQFLEGVVKIISNASHVCAINFWNCIDIVIRFSHVERFIGITEAGSDWLVNEDNVVLFGPAVVISLDIVGLHVGSSESEGTQFKEITELA